MTFWRIWQVVFLFLVMLPPGLFAQRYEEVFQKGLELEAAEDWPAAVETYLKANQLEPSKPFPLQRIEAIFQGRLAEGEGINSLRVLLPAELDKALEKKGAYILRDSYKKKSDTSLIGGIIAAVVLISAVLIGMYLKQRKKVKPAKTKATKSPEPKMSVAPSTSKKSKAIPTEHRAKVAPVITEKTREEMQGMFSTVKSESPQPAPIPELNAEALEDLKNSEVVQALADTLVSELGVEETPQGKYSKLTLDASLFFDAEDVEFFEKEFSDDSKGGT